MCFDHRRRGARTSTKKRVLFYRQPCLEATRCFGVAPRRPERISYQQNKKTMCVLIVVGVVWGGRSVSASPRLGRKTPRGRDPSELGTAWCRGRSRPMCAKPYEFLCRGAQRPELSVKRNIFEAKTKTPQTAVGQRPAKHYTHCHIGDNTLQNVPWRRPPQSKNHPNTKPATEASH